MKRALFAILVVIASGAQASPQGQPWKDYEQTNTNGPVLAVGYATESCETVVNGQNPTQETVSKFYSWGIWTGLNIGHGLLVGSSTDAPGIWGEVKLECAQHPAETLVTATTNVYYRFKKSRR